MLVLVKHVQISEKSDCTLEIETSFVLCRLNRLVTGHCQKHHDQFEGKFQSC